MIWIIIAFILILAAVKIIFANNIDNSSLDAGYNLEVKSIGSYSGPYVEDGTNVEVSDVLMIEVENKGESPVQYGEIRLMEKGGEFADFKFSTLMPGDKMTVLEAEKKEKGILEKYTEAAASKVAYFQNYPNTHSEELKIESLNGGLNITNISEQDIKGEIVVYFKNSKNDQFFGGITYRGRIEGGLKSGEIRQLMSRNFTAKNTEVVFVTIDGK